MFHKNLETGSKPVSHNLKISLKAIFACLLWSTAFVGLKIGLKYSPPYFFAGIRFMISGFMILPFCGSPRKIFKKIKKDPWIIIKVSFFQTFLLYALFYQAMSYVSGAQAAITIGASPLFAALIAHLLLKHDSLNFKRLVILLLGFSGIIIIVLSRNEIVSTKYRYIGTGLLIMVNIVSAIGNILVAKDKGKIDAYTLTGTQIFLGGFMLLILSLIIERGEIRFIQAYDFYLSLFWLSFISAVAFSLWFYLLKIPGTKVSSLNVWKFIIPVFGAVLSWVMLPEETANLNSVLGMLLVSGSIILYQRFS